MPSMILVPTVVVGVDLYVIDRSKRQQGARVNDEAFGFAGLDELRLDPS